jgi:hypothetical protein
MRSRASTALDFIPDPVKEAGTAAACAPYTAPVADRARSAGQASRGLEGAEFRPLHRLSSRRVLLERDAADRVELRGHRAGACIC